MWRDGHRRRSPRISALDTWKAHQPTATFSSKKCMWVREMEGHQGPPSRTRTRVKRKIQQQGIEDPIHEDHSTNSDQPLVTKAKGSAKLDDHATSTGQRSVVSAVPSMPEKRILELVLDILQRRDTYEIFAEPVDPKEVEDYYEIIKEPMDFGTMRAKLHEGFYNNLEQFEHDALLIPRNAMHFNSTATIYFRQARAIYELAKKVFHFLKTDPQNFELEFSRTRRRSGRRPQGEGKCLNFNSYPSPRLATNVRSSTLTNDVSSKGTWCSLSGPSNLRRSLWGNPGFSCTATCLDKRDYDFSPDYCEHDDNENTATKEISPLISYYGARDGRRSNFDEADRRCTYRPLMPFHNENDSIGSTIYSEPKPLARVNQWDISYRQSLLLFAKDLGPTAQMIANRKLQGWWKDAPSLQTPASNCWGQATTCQVPAAFTSAQKGPATLDTETTNTSSRGFVDPLPGYCSVPKTLTDTVDLTDSDDGEKACTTNKKGNHSALAGKFATNNERGRMGDHIASGGKVAYNNEGSTSLECHATKIVSICGGDEILENPINKIHLGLYPSSSGTGGLNSSVIRLNETSKKPMAATVDSSRMDNHVQQSRSHSSECGFKLRNSKSPTSSSWPWHTGGVSGLSWTDGSAQGKGSKHEPPVAAEVPKGGMSSSSSQASQHVASPFAFDLPFLKSRLDQMNHMGYQNGFLQPRFQQVAVNQGPSSGRTGSNKRTSEGTHQAILPSQLAINNQECWVLDTWDTDLALQL